jgi:hypothetical protein
MPPGIQGRVGQHRNPYEFQPIQNTAGHIAPTAASAGLPAAVEMIAKLIGLIPANGHNGIVGTHHITHGTANAFISRIGSLADAVIGTIYTGGGIHESHGGLQIPFTENPELDGVNRADRRAFAAKRTRVFIPDNLPGQIFDT